GDITRRLEHADLAHLLQAHPAGAEIGNAAVGELDPGIGDVLGFRNEADSHAVDPRHLRLHQLQHDPDVVDHQVEHHADLGATRREWRQALGGDEAGIGDLTL